MKKITKSEFKKFKRDKNGILYLPSADYSLIDSFGEWCSFGEGCRFGERCSFGLHHHGEECRAPREPTGTRMETGRTP